MSDYDPTTHEDSLAYISALVRLYMASPGDTEEEQLLSDALTLACARYGYEDLAVREWGATEQKGQAPARCLRSGNATRGERLTLGEVRSLVPGDRVWYNYQKSEAFPNRINEPGTVVFSDDIRFLDVELESGELYHFDLANTAASPPDAPAVSLDHPGQTTLYAVVGDE